MIPRLRSRWANHAMGDLLVVAGSVEGWALTPFDAIDRGVAPPLDVRPPKLDLLETVQVMVKDLFEVVPEP